MSVILELRKIATGYDDLPVIQDISLSIHSGEFLGILGSNGSGKSTLLRVMAGLMPTWEGNVLIQDKPLNLISRKQLARQISFIPQTTYSDIDLTVREMVALGRSPHLGRLQRLKQIDYDKVEASLLSVDLEKLGERSFRNLSGGERQRVILARALAQEPRILLLDEPTSHLDLSHQVEFFHLLQELHSSASMTIICVSHDINLCSNYVDRVAILNEGKLYGIGRVEELLKKEILERVFHTPVLVGQHPQTGRPHVYLEKNEIS